MEADCKRGEGGSGGDVQGKKWKGVSGWVRAGLWVGRERRGKLGVEEL